MIPSTATPSAIAVKGSPAIIVVGYIMLGVSSERPSQLIIVVCTSSQLKSKHRLSPKKARRSDANMKFQQEHEVCAVDTQALSVNAYC